MTTSSRSELFEIGEKHSRLSKAIFVVVLVIPLISAILFGAVDENTWILINTLTAVILVLWIADAWLGRALLINADMLLLPVIGLLVIGCVQLLPLFAPTLPPGLTAEAPRGTISMDPYATRMFVMQLVSYIVFFAATLTFACDRRRLQKVVVIVVVFGALMAFAAILLRLAVPDAIYGLRVTPQAISFGPFVNQHHFAAFMEMTSGLTFGLLFGGNLKRERQLLLMLAAAVMGIAVVMTGSRGGMLGFAAMLLFVLAATLFARKGSGDVLATGSNQRIAAAAATIVVVIIICGAVLFLGADTALVRGLGLGGGDDISNGRSHFWPIAVRIFLDHPILGAGFDAFGVAFTKYDTWSGLYRVEQAHNDYLQTLSDAGIAGFACVCLFIYLLFRRGMATIAKATDGFSRSAAVGAIGGCLGILTHSFFDFPLRTPSNAFFFLLLATVATTGKTVKVSEPSLAGPFSHREVRTLSDTGQGSS